MITGSCLCGAVSYHLTGPVGDIVHCHCETCRKTHSSAFSSVAAVADGDFHLQAVAGQLSHYESSPGKQRWFCQACGSHIYAKRQGTAHVILRLGSLDNDSLNAENTPRERSHIWTSQQASWYQNNAELPVFDEAEPAADR
ncbi:GFA family protein [Aliamphritea hakodatensis]|uniref:GFA family protein n=1 Tax=Aliamphritea hakodatensis TaxID=2895352 RepID=UPI0022FD857E|nr:GFA family protein [Aliamphritea hakodatensis]